MSQHQYPARTPALCGRSTETESDHDAVLLFRRWREQRDAAARARLVERFMPLAHKLARRYIGANEPFEDLLQVASLGLVLAIDRFDPDRGFAFTSFAVPTILGELRRYFRDLGWAAHVPRRAQERAQTVEKTREELVGTLGRVPTLQQIAQVLEWSVEDVLAALEAAWGHHASSLDAPSGAADSDGDGENDALVDRLGHIDPGYDLVESRASVESAMRMVPVKERRVLYLRFIDEMTQSEIGQQIGVSQMQVSRMLQQALSRLTCAADPA